MHRQLATQGNARGILVYHAVGCFSSPIHVIRKANLLKIMTIIIIIAFKAKKKCRSKEHTAERLPFGGEKERIRHRCAWQGVREEEEKKMHAAKLF